MGLSEPGRRVGRPEKALSDGPVAALAGALRELREACGAPTYTRLEHDAGGVNARRLADAARGDSLPAWKHVRAYVYACWKYARAHGIAVAGSGEIGPWERLYRAAGGNLGEPARPVHRPSAAAQPPPVRRPVRGRIRAPRRGWARLATGLVCMVVVLALPASSASRAVPATRTAWCAYVTALPAPVLSAPSARAAPVKTKDLGNGIEILPLPHPPGWWPVFTPYTRPDRGWMPADVLSSRVAGTRPCPDQAVATVTAYNTDYAQEQFAVGSDCRVYHRWQLAPGGAFSRWSSLEGCASARQGLGVGLNGDGDLVAFVISPDHTVRYRSQPRPGLGPWVGWTSLGGDVSTGLRVVGAANASSPLRVFARDEHGRLWENDQAQANCCWSGWRRV